ncbi:MAG: PAS domain S-box protein [Deltaproteobacteria bacterium]|nr:PAS domain S-box protein [Deltaproteobacteria bacterium]
MGKKPTYEELEQRVRELEGKLAKGKRREDITERRRVGDELRESEERFRSIFSQSLAGIEIYDADGRLTDINPACMEIFGIKKPDKVIGFDLFTDPNIPPDARGRLERGEGVEYEAAFDFELVRQRALYDTTKSGQCYLSCFITPLVALDNSIMGYLVNVQDVTERKRMEDALRDSEAMFRDLFERHAAIKLIIDPDTGNIVDANIAAAEFYGWTREQLRQMKIQDINTLPPEEIMQEMEKARARERIHFEFRHRRADGSIRDVEVFSSKIETKGRDLLHSIIHDITDRKRAEAALRESEERFRALFEETSTPIQGYSPDGTIHFWNRASAKTYGYEKAEAIGRNLVDLIIPPEMRDYAWGAIRQAVETGHVVPAEELRLMRKDGSRVSVFSSHVVIGHGRKAPELYCLDVDMTEREQLTARLQQAQKMEAIATLAGGIAHQFNNALTVITGSLDLLEMDFPEGEIDQGYVRRMRSSIRLMSQLTAQLLAYARGGKYLAKAISLGSFIRETLPLIAHTIKHSVHVETDLPLDLRAVKVDQTQMQMAISAILSNASEAIEGKGRIRITCRNVEIRAENSQEYPDLRPGPYVCLAIQDDGKGMDEETKRRVFEPFFTTKFQGRGLGMAAVYGIVKGHNGWISIGSGLGKGTTIRIYLPALEAVAKEHAEPKTDIPKGSGTVLLIEDEDAVMEISHALLERLGYRVLKARTGEEAIRLAETFDGDIDVALLDIFLPDMEGRAVFPFLMKARPNLKVIVCSGYSLEGPAQEVLDSGAHAFVQKPFSIGDISTRLKEVMGRTQDRKSV